MEPETNLGLIPSTYQMNVTLDTQSITNLVIGATIVILIAVGLTAAFRKLF